MTKREKTKGGARATMTRRGFMKRGAVAAVGMAGFPYIVPASALGLDGTTAPSNRITIGGIGSLPLPVVGLPRANSRARVRTQGLLGDRLIDIAPGSADQRILADGDTLCFGDNEFEFFAGHADG